MEDGTTASTDGTGDELEALLEAELLDSEADDPSSDPQTIPSPPRIDSGHPHEPDRKRRRTNSGSRSVGHAAVCPPHPGTIHGICIRCGAAVAQQDTTTDEQVGLRYIHQGLQISKAEAERLREWDLQRTLGGKKLLLVLDLDHTLLNSTRINELSPELDTQLQQVLVSEEGKPEQSLFRLPGMAMWTKLRPHVREFLAAAHALAEMHIYTHGDRDYARAMAAILDPSRALFQDRIISQADSTRRGVKHLDVMLGSESAVVILDDTEAVWPNHQDNLIQVDRYLFFPADAQRFRCGRSLLEQGLEESPQEGQLSTALRILTSLHQRMFAAATGDSDGAPDVRRHLRRLKAGVLEGVQVCFTKIIPLGLARPEEHHLWRLANQLGAACSLSLTPGVTHLVAGGDKTEKAVEAEKLGIPIVSPDWLYASGLALSRGEHAAPVARRKRHSAWLCAAFRWQRAEEARFPVGREPPSTRADPAADLAAAQAAAGGAHGTAAD